MNGKPSVTVSTADGLAQRGCARSESSGKNVGAGGGIGEGRRWIAAAREMEIRERVEERMKETASCG